MAGIPCNYGKCGGWCVVWVEGCGGCMWLGVGCLCEDSHMEWVSLIASLTRLLCMNGSSWVRVVRLMGYWLAIMWLIML